MCGICGAAGPGIDKDVVRGLMVAMQSRGKHSAGIAAIDSKANNATVFKEAVAAIDLVKMDGYAAAVEHDGIDVLIGHTRYATHGAKTAENSHPFVEGDIIGTHNGVIDNHKDLVVDAADVDSQTLFRAMSRQDYSPATFADVEGYMALAWYDGRDRSLNFAKSGSPLIIAFDVSTDTYYWASEEEPLVILLEAKGIDYVLLEDLKDGEGMTVPLDHDGEYYPWEFKKLERSRSAKSYYTGAGSGTSLPTASTASAAQYTPEAWGFKACDLCDSWLDEKEVHEDDYGFITCKECYEDYEGGTGQSSMSLKVESDYAPRTGRCEDCRIVGDIYDDDEGGDEVCIDCHYDREDTRRALWAAMDI